MADDLPFLNRPDREEPAGPPEPPGRARWGIARDMALGVLLLAVALGVIGRLRSPGLPGEAPDFSLPALDGAEVRLSGLRGRTVVLNFWATWCGPCRVEIPTFSSFAAAHPDIAVLGVAVDGRPEALQQAAASLGITYPVLIADRPTLSAYRVSTLPMTVIVDPEGRVSATHTGLMLRPHLAWAAGVIW